jgi:hypothetical protein
MAETNPAPLTGVRSLYDVVRHLLAHGPARNDAERDELVGAVNAADPDYTEPEHVMTAEEKAAAYDEWQSGQKRAASPAEPSPAERFPASGPEAEKEIT